MQMTVLNAGHHESSLGHEPALIDIPHLSHVNTTSYQAMIVEDDDWLHDFAAIHSSPTASAAVAAGSFSSPTASAAVAVGNDSSPTASAAVAADNHNSPAAPAAVAASAYSSPTVSAAVAAGSPGSAGQEGFPQPESESGQNSETSAESGGQASATQGADASVAGTDEHQVTNRLIPCNCADASQCKATVLCGLRCSA